MTSEIKRFRLRTLNRHLTTQYARDQVNRALFEVAVDGLELGACQLPLAADRDWLRGALAVPINEATAVALDVLAWRIDQILNEAPVHLRERFDQRYAEEFSWG